MNVYHYSYGIRLDSILKSGLLRPIGNEIPRHERPAVWFTTNDVWEPTTAVIEMDQFGRLDRQLSMQECHEKVGLIRFVVNESSAPYTWRDHKKLGRMDRCTAKIALCHGHCSRILATTIPAFLRSSSGLEVACRRDMGRRPLAANP